MKAEIKMREEPNPKIEEGKNHFIDLELEPENPRETLLLKDFQKDGGFDVMYESHIDVKWENEKLVLIVDHMRWQKYKENSLK